MSARRFVFTLITALIVSFAPVWANAQDDSGMEDAGAKAAAATSQAVRNQQATARNQKATPQNQKTTTQDAPKSDEDSDRPIGSLILGQYSALGSQRLDHVDKTLKTLKALDALRCKDATEACKKRNSEIAETFETLNASIANQVNGVEADYTKASTALDETKKLEFNALKVEQKFEKSFSYFALALLVVALLVCIIEFLHRLLNPIPETGGASKEDLKAVKAALKTASDELEAVKQQLEALKPSTPQTQTGIASVATLATDAAGQAITKAAAAAQTTLDILGKIKLTTSWYGPVLLLISLLFYWVMVRGAIL